MDWRDRLVVNFLGYYSPVFQCSGGRLQEDVKKFGLFPVIPADAPLIEGKVPLLVRFTLAGVKEPRMQSSLLESYDKFDVQSSIDGYSKWLCSGWEAPRLPIHAHGASLYVRSTRGSGPSFFFRALGLSGEVRI